MSDTPDETLLNTPIEDLRITGKHSIPDWLVNPRNDHKIDAFLCAVAALEVEGEQESEVGNER